MDRSRVQYWYDVTFTETDALGGKERRLRGVAHVSASMSQVRAMQEVEIDLRAKFKVEHGSVCTWDAFNPEIEIII